MQPVPASKNYYYIVSVVIEWVHKLSDPPEAWAIMTLRKGDSSENLRVKVS